MSGKFVILTFKIRNPFQSVYWSMFQIFKLVIGIGQNSGTLTNERRGLEKTKPRGNT